MLTELFIFVCVLGIIFAVINQYVRRLWRRFGALYEVKLMSGGTVIVGQYRLHRLQKAERVSDFWVL